MTHADTLKNISNSIIRHMDIGSNGQGSQAIRDEIEQWIEAHPNRKEKIIDTAFAHASDKDKHTKDDLNDVQKLAGFIEHRLTDLIKKRVTQSLNS